MSTQYIFGQCFNCINRIKMLNVKLFALIDSVMTNCKNSLSQSHPTLQHPPEIDVIVRPSGTKNCICHASMNAQIKTNLPHLTLTFFVIANRVITNRSLKIQSLVTIIMALNSSLNSLAQLKVVDGVYHKWHHKPLIRLLVTVICDCKQTTQIFRYVTVITVNMPLSGKIIFPHQADYNNLGYDITGRQYRIHRHAGGTPLTYNIFG
jgi:hypothetical protein